MASMVLLSSEYWSTEILFHVPRDRKKIENSLTYIHKNNY